jgi:hypothetical protein
MMNNTTKVNMELISFCGLYCAECSKYKKGKCSGCNENTKATWCKIRTCCLEKEVHSCADCTEFELVKDCKKFNSFFGRVMERIFSSDRQTALQMIREKGYDHFAGYMEENELITIPRRKTHKTK